MCNAPSNTYIKQKLKKVKSEKNTKYFLNLEKANANAKIITVKWRICNITKGNHARASHVFQKRV